MNEKTHSPAYGPIMMVIAALLFSTGGLLCKVIPWSALAINGARNLIACMLIGSYLLLTKHKLRLNFTTFLGALCSVGVTTLFVLANKLTTAANAVVLQYSAPVWIIVFMALFFRKMPKKRDILTIAVVFVGILCFFFDDISAGHYLGDLVAILAGLFYGGLFLINSTKDGDTLSSLFLGQLISGLAMSGFMLGETDFSAGALLGVAALGVFQVGLAYIFFSEGTKYTDPVAAVVIDGIEPILNPLLVAVFWHELIRPLSLVGAVIVVAAILFHQIRQK